MIAPYLLRPIIVLGLLALAAGPASTLVNLRRAEFGAETMVHGVFPGIVVGMAVGGREGIIPGGALCAALIAASLTAASRRPRSSEATTAVLLTAFFSLGIVISLRIGDMSGQLESLMFGRLLDITPHRMWTSAAVLVVAAVVLALTWRAQIAVAFDREAARVSGMAALSALVGGWAGFGVALLRAPRPLSPQACVALGVLTCFALACALQQLREVRMGRDEASAGSQGTLTARETVRETGDRVGDNAASVRETARETRSSDLPALGEVS